ncbi:MAG: glycosyltransferase family 2 protein [Acaryochloridaceae cyanobacterium SU_2_1]|nr:glycosyltransferase family 2 protein [Acaryochloridaceae cyanobacterium SU_2_1]NJM95213.1 glycosyltransferase family 2 protein [Acaryochloridaceae cyanobacterium CSU_5_19]
MVTAPTILVVIVNYRTPQLAVDCLRSLDSERSTLPNLQVAMVDNHSEDDSLAVIGEAIAREGWQSWVTLHPLPHNGGFAHGNNAVIRPALESDCPPDYLWLLNPDTVVRPGSLTALLAFFKEHPRVGIAGSRLEDIDGRPQYSAFRFPSLWSEFDQGLRLGIVSKLLSDWVVAPPIAGQVMPTDWVAGASMMVRSAVFTEIGLLDEAYFMYYEEVDFCLRASQAGWPCWYVPESRVVHLVGQSSGVTGATAAQRRRPQYWFDSRRRYFCRYYGRAYAALTDAAWMLGFGLWQLRRWLQRKPAIDPPLLFQDFLRHSALVRGGE